MDIVLPLSKIPIFNQMLFICRICPISYCYFATCLDTIIVSTPTFVKGKFFLNSLLEDFQGEEKGGDIFFHSFGGRLKFHDPKIEICKINYCENIVKLNNKDNSKNNVNEIEKIVQPMYFIFIKFPEFFAAGICQLKLSKN